MSAITMAELLRQSRAAGDFSILIRAVPFAQFIGLELVEEKGELLGRLRASPHLVGNPMLPALHGGVLGALLESCAIFHVLSETAVPRAPKTISFTVQYLRSAKLADTYARAEMVRQGRRVASVRSIAWQDDPAKPLAAASVQLLLPAADTGSTEA